MRLSNLRGLLIAVTVLALLGGAGTHWYLQSKVKNLVAAIIKQLYPVAVISYEDTYSSLWDSSIGVEQLTINPRSVRGELKIERIVFQAPNLEFLMDAEKALENGDIPQKLRIAFDNINMSTEGNIARVLYKNSSSPQLGARDNAYACADVNQFGFVEMAEMGYERLSVDLNISYEYIASEDNLNVSALWSNRNMFELEISSTFDMERKRFKFKQIKRLFDQMSSIKITYRDLGFNQKTIDYCNERRGDQEYVPAHIEAFKQDLWKQLSIVPSNTLVEAYRTFMLESGEIDITSNMPRAINPDYLGLYSPQDVILLVRPEIFVNDQPVDIPFEALLKHAPGMSGADENLSADNQVDPDPVNVQEFIKVTIPQLAEHIGDMVRVTTKQGPTRTGILVDTSQSRIKVEVAYRGGTATYPIFISNIADTEVKELPPTGAQ
ncbi:MAG: hypothetical protein JAY90_15755 [Candidatus Thiodiazotropha lotti]|nr:hypothetical protein [Candidatus Thiodiazotropha lotti]